MQTLRRVIGPVGAKAVFGAGADIRDDAKMDIVGMAVELEAADLMVEFVLDRDIERRCRLRIDGEIDALGGERRAQPGAAAGARNQLRLQRGVRIK
jgi:hypothetical protein